MTNDADAVAQRAWHVPLTNRTPQTNSFLKFLLVGTIKPTAQRLATARFSSSAADSNEVYTAEMVDSIEWAVESPPPLHCFEEPPILIEVQGMENNAH